MKTQTLIRCAAFAVAAWTGSAQAGPNAWLAIDLPGADGRMVTLTGISGHETITGYYSQTSAQPAFVRTPDGVVTTFTLGSTTDALAIDIDGDVTGWYFDGTAAHGFLRAADGTATTIDAPGADSTTPVAINDSGTIAGFYNIGNTVYGFVRLADGTFKSFGVPGQTTTVVTALNKCGATAGYYGPNAHGFIRGKGGAITSFDLPGGQRGLTVASLNAGGDVAGDYVDAGFATHGFIRHKDGGFETFDVPGSNPNHPIHVVGMNDDGNLVGTVFSGSRSHGFARATDGTITILDAPGVTTAATFPTAIGPNGKIVGYDNDGHGHNAGFRLNAAGAGF